VRQSLGEWRRLLICIGYSLRLWALGFGVGAACGYVGGVALGWSKHFAYWGMPILKLIGPVPVTAWIPVTFYFFPTTFDASLFIVALASGIPVMILTSSGVASVTDRRLRPPCTSSTRPSWGRRTSAWLRSCRGTSPFGLLYLRPAVCCVGVINEAERGDNDRCGDKFARHLSLHGYKHFCLTTL
jgi:hypothetical protein